MKMVFQADDRWSNLIHRIMLDLAILPHGAQKLFGWFGGPGVTGTMG